jgi:adenylyl cyclase-associated protein
LLAEIQQKALSVNLTHVEKGAYKKNLPPPVEPKKPLGGAQKAAPVPAVKKDPKKELKYNSWYIENYGKEVLKFEGDDATTSHSFNIMKCTDTTIVISGKIKNVMLNDCQGVKLILDSVISMIELLNCKKISCTIKVVCPQFMIERSHGIQLYLFPSAKGTKINSTCSQSMVINYPLEGAKEDDEWIDATIPETYVSQIKGDKVVSEALDGME